jgi:putative transposase
VKYACIARHWGEFTVRLMCRVLEVGPSGFYAWRVRAPSERAQGEERLRLHIRSLHRTTKERYGALKLHSELSYQGVKCGHNRVARLMREEGLMAKRARRFRVTTQSAHNYPLAQNRLERRFQLSDNPQIDRVWAADITYLPTREGWLYLAVVLDVASRRVIGWSLDRFLDRALPIRALTMALARRRPRSGLLHHSDRGSQYASMEYQKILSQSGLLPSMSRAGDCWDNAVAESFFATLKTELVFDADWHTRHEARRAVGQFIEIWYNRQRRHQTLGYQTPVQYEIEVLKRAEAA